MPSRVQDKRLALDTNLLIDMAAGIEAAHAFRERFQAAGYDLRIPPTVMAELAFFALGKEGEPKRLASIALRSVLQWKITPIIMSPMEARQRRNFVSFVQDRGVLPAAEEHDANILAEVGIADIKGLVTSDAAILNADPRELERAFKDSGISPVIPVSPSRMLKSLR